MKRESSVKEREQREETQDQGKSSRLYMAMHSREDIFEMPSLIPLSSTAASLERQRQLFPSFGE